MSNLRAETAAAAKLYYQSQLTGAEKCCEGCYNKAINSESYFDRSYLAGSLNGPPLLRALEALNTLKNKWNAVDATKSVSYNIVAKALKEIEAARGSGE